MRFVNRSLALACLISTLAPGSIAPCRADSAPASPPQAGASRLPEALSLDLANLSGEARLCAATPAPERQVSPGPIHYQTGGGWSGMSTAKKTWIIVGIVVGAGVIVALVSNSGDSGGGGY